MNKRKEDSGWGLKIMFRVTFDLNWISQMQTPNDQLDKAKKLKDYDLCARLLPFARAHQDLEALLEAAEKANDFKKCSALQLELDKFPKTVDEFEKVTLFSFADSFKYFVQSRVLF